MKASTAVKAAVKTAKVAGKAAKITGKGVLLAGRATEATARVSHDIDSKVIGLTAKALKGTLKFAFKQAHKAYKKLEAKHGARSVGYRALAAVFTAAAAVPVAQVLGVAAAPALAAAGLGVIALNLAHVAKHASKNHKQAGL